MNTGERSGNIKKTRELKKPGTQEAQEHQRRPGTSEKPGNTEKTGEDHKTPGKIREHREDRGTSEKPGTQKARGTQEDQGTQKRPGNIREAREHREDQGTQRMFIFNVHPQYLSSVFILSVDLQVVECLPVPVPLGRQVVRGKGGRVTDWKDWFTHHTVIHDNISATVGLISQWWHYTGLAHPGEASLQASLERIVTNVFSTVLTIGHCPFWFPSLTSTLHQYNEIHIHLLGADEPEVGAVESGLMQVASRVLGRPIVVTLVAPDLAHHPQTFSWTPTRPHQVTSSVRAVTYSGLYHDFWRDHLATSDTHAQVSRPQVALAIHPGVHTDEMLVLWKPTLQLLAYEHVPLVMTTYNEAEFHTTLQKLETLQANVVHGDVNPLRSLHLKQTPYEPDHVWAANSYIIAIDNSRTS
nr:putative protein MSS51 homolog, mitochondrial [Cherax quadricarinatus]